MEENTTVIRLEFAPKTRKSYLIVTWNEEIEVLLIRGDTCYKGAFRIEDLEKFYTNLRQSKEQYGENLKKALTTKSGSKEYVFELRDQFLYWKEVATDNTSIKIVCGSLQFTDVLEEGGCDILVETLFRLNKNLEKRLAVKDTEMLAMHDELEEFTKKYEVFSNMKNKMEEDIYQSFLGILNEKKRKIRLLQDIIEETNKEKTRQNQEAKTTSKKSEHPFVDSDSE